MVRRTRKALRPGLRKRITRGGSRGPKELRQSLPPPGPSQCHPRLGMKAGGCLPESVLKGVAEKIGIRGSGSGGGTPKSNSHKQSLLHKVAKHLGIPETNQRSILNALPISEEEKQQLAKAWLRPEQPAGWKEDPDMWLDSLNIKSVMDQYEEAYPTFKFMGPFPIDFAAKDPYEKGEEKCIIGEMCNLNLKKLAAEGKEMIGIVYNLDPHYKDGSHWVASFINIPKKTCYYFDSYGMKPPQQIYKFMQWLTLQEPAMKLGWNGRRFQRRNSECGMYCMYFLDRMIRGDPYLKFVRRSPPDRFMLDLRDWMFST